MNPTNLAVRLTAFLTQYLGAQRDLSPNTVKSYRDSFKLLLKFCQEARGIAPEKLTIEKIDASLVEAFLDHLEKERHSKASTRNNRLSALHAFFRYLQIEEPDRMLQCQRILAIPLKRCPKPVVGYLAKENLAAVLAQPDLGTRYGRRDAVLLTVLYDAGARAQELVDLRVRDLRLDTPAHLRITGKGRKVRGVPLLKGTIEILDRYLREQGLERPERLDDPLFTNRRGGRLSRSGIRYILKKHVESARNVRPGLTQKVSPHTLRHSKGMHLVDCGVPLEYIRDLFGHSDAKTTQIYARANLEMKKRALEKAGQTAPLSPFPSWHQDKNLLDWLRSL
jgi:integrase/recombinase XerD